MPVNLLLYRRNPIEKYNKNLIEKSNQLYNELLEIEIIPEMERENGGDCLSKNSLKWCNKLMKSLWNMTKR